MSEYWQTETPEETIRLAGQQSQQWESPRVVALTGELGSGKTTFVKRVVSSFGGDKTKVRSPSFTLVNEYTDTSLRVVHADLYRAESSGEQLTIGLEDYFDRGYVLVEWANYWTGSWPEDSIGYRFKHVEENVRRIERYDPT
ncbi:MAG: tRNA (adenosine(37)-N6)-threonylcarbamoyltransferase complex ATPase subunit type 1 TsaE [bacterium]